MNSMFFLPKGGDPNPLSEIPMAEGDIWRESSSYVGYVGVPQENACLSTDGVNLSKNLSTLITRNLYLDLPTSSCQCLRRK